MASEVFQILNLSPIPELSEMELSTVLEQLSGYSDHNGDFTDRNVEDILREAEELIDTSISVKTESVDSKGSLNYIQKSGIKGENSELDISPEMNGSKCDQPNVESQDILPNSKESATGIVNISLSGDCLSLKDEKSECTISNRNEIDSSEIEVTPVQTPRSLTNHIQSTLISLRECSKKIENKKKVSPLETAEQPYGEFSNNDQVSFPTREEKSETFKSKPKRNEFSLAAERENNSANKVTKEEAVMQIRKFVVKENCGKNISLKKGSRSLTLNESIKTLNCFERLYRGKSAMGDSKRLKPFERISNNKKSSSLKVSKTVNPTKLETIHKVRKSKESESLLPGKKTKPYVFKELDGKYNNPGENIIDEDFSFEKCLKLLNDESEGSTNMIDMASFSYNEFAGKMLKECSDSVRELRGEMEVIKSQMKKNETSKDPAAISEPYFIQQISSQENLVQILKEENSKLFKEIEGIKEQLKVNVETSNCNRATEKVEVVEKLRSEVENLRRSLITAYSENNGISRLEEQFSLLKRKYDLQIGKLEDENKRLKDILGTERPSTCKDSARREVGIQTETSNGRVGEVEWKTRKMVRSASLENCRRISNAPSFISHSCENVDAATSPISSTVLRGDKELCSVSIQCKGEWDVEGDRPVIGKGAFRQINRLENKENMLNTKKDAGKTRSNSSNQVLHPLKQKKWSEHENQLMVTIRALHSEITVKDRDNKRLRNELEAARNQIRRLTVGLVKHKNDLTKKYCHIGTQTIGLAPKMHDAYDPAMFQVSRELESENEELKSKVEELEKVVDILKEKRISDLQVLQKLHEEEIEKLASRLNTQTALTNHLHSLLTNR